MLCSDAVIITESQEAVGGLEDSGSGGERWREVGSVNFSITSQRSPS